MKPLTFQELVRCMGDRQLVKYHPDFVPEYWKDGRALAFRISSIAAMPRNKGDKKDKYFIKYRCMSIGPCERCDSDSYDGHFIVINEDGYDEFDRVEFIELKKKTEIKLHKHPVFVKYEEK